MTTALTLTAEGIRHSYRGSDFELSVDRIEAPAGRTLALLGPSGSGKTSLLHVMGLLEAPRRGRVLLDGREVTAGDRDARLAMAAVFQRPYLFKGSVAQNVTYGLSVRGVPRAERPARVAAALEMVGLAGYESRGAHALSGGEAQRVSLARALALEPRVLLLDEPLASLDPLLKRRLTREFAAIVRDAGATVVWVTHDQDEALVAADSVALVRDGRVVTLGPTDEVMSLPRDEWVAAFLGLEEPVRATVGESADGLVRLDTGGAAVWAVGAASVGEQVSFAVRPEDVLLFEPGVELPATTARNRIEAQVVALEPRGATMHVVLDAHGTRLAASVSRASVADLGLAAGARVLVVFKATAVRWRSLSGNGEPRDTLT